MPPGSQRRASTGVWLGSAVSAAAVVIMQVVTFSSSRRSLFPLTFRSRPPGGSVRTRRGTRADDSRVGSHAAGCADAVGFPNTAFGRPSQHLSLYQISRSTGRVALPRIGFGIADDRPVLRLSLPNTRGYRRDGGDRQDLRRHAQLLVLPCSPWNSSLLMIRPALLPAPTFTNSMFRAPRPTPGRCSASAVRFTPLSKKTGAE